MNPGRRILLASLVVLAASGCAPAAPPPVDTSKDVAALKAMQDRELAVVSTCNPDTAVTAYTADVVMMPPGEPVINGTAALHKWFEGFCKDYSASGKYASADVQVAGDWAVVRYTGELTMTPKKGGKPMTEAIKGNHIYKKQADGRWLIAQDVWNSDAAPPPPPK